jgi:opacity protein-like surface antigen
MKKSIFIALIVALLLPAVASAQLITSAQVITVKEKKQGKPLHYEQSIEFTEATDFEDKGGDRSVYGLEYIGGIRFSNLFFLGAGIGINFHSYSYDFDLSYSDAYGLYCNDCPENLVSVPLYLHTRLYFTDTRCQPFFALSVGGQVTGRKDAKYHKAYYNPSCFMINPQLGVNYQLNDKLGMYLTVGCMIRDIVYTVYYYPSDNETYVNHDMGEGIAMKMSLGVTF